MKKKAKLNFKTVDGFIFYYPEEIYYFKSEGIYAYVHDGKSQHFINASLKTIETQIPEDIFIKCHRGYIVNIRKVAKIIKATNYSLLLENGIEVPISRNRKGEIMMRLGIDK